MMSCTNFCRHHIQDRKIILTFQYLMTLYGFMKKRACNLLCKNGHKKRWNCFQNLNCGQTHEIRKNLDRRRRTSHPMISDSGFVPAGSLTASVVVPGEIEAGLFWESWLKLRLSEDNKGRVEINDSAFVLSMLHQFLGRSTICSEDISQVSASWTNKTLQTIQWSTCRVFWPYRFSLLMRSVKSRVSMRSMELANQKRKMRIFFQTKKKSFSNTKESPYGRHRTPSPSTWRR